MPDMYPPVPPTVSGQFITVEQWLNNPTRVERVISNLAAQRFIIDRIFSKGPQIPSGAVIYDQVTINDLYPVRDVQEIAPGSDFPLVDVGELAPLVAAAKKYGGAGEITYEEIDRDRRDVLQRKITRIVNALVRKSDVVGIAALRAAPINAQVASASWATAGTDIFADVATGISFVDALDMDYAIDSALISPKTALNMLKNTTLRSALPRENVGSPNPVLVGKLAGVAGITNWYKSNRITDDEVFLLEGQTAGSWSDEKPMYSRVVDLPWAEKKLVMAGRRGVPFITDPKSVVRISGVQ